MKVCLLLALITIPVFLHAQETPEFPDMRCWRLWIKDKADDRYIFADTAYVRVTPDTKQPPADTLFAGDDITITEITSNVLTIRGLKGPWLKISYTKNGESKTGYIWQGLISCPPLRRGDVKFVYGIERRADSNTIKRFQVVLKVVQKGSVVAKTSFLTWDDESANFSEGKVMSGMGLTNVSNFVVLTFSGEACGIPTYDYYIAFTKSTQLVRFPIKENIADAGVFYHEETFTFPSEKNGKPNKVILNKKSEEVTEKIDQNGDPVFKTTEKKTEQYAWNGTTGTLSALK